MNRMPHPAENMELYYEARLRIEGEFEKIKIVSQKLAEKYGEYDELKNFVEYLAAMERIFASAKAENWSDRKIKEELVASEVRSFSESSGIDEKVFEDITKDFVSAYSDIRQIYEATDKLLQKYEACDGCKQFIEYLKKITVIFFEAKDRKLDMGRVKNDLYDFKMKSLSADGNPELEILEGIKFEFELGISGKTKK